MIRKGTKPHIGKRNVVSVQLYPDLDARLNAMLDRIGSTKIQLTTRILSFFLELPEEVQFCVLNRPPAELHGPILQRVMEVLIARGEADYLDRAALSAPTGPGGPSSEPAGKPQRAKSAHASRE